MKTISKVLVVLVSVAAFVIVSYAVRSMFGVVSNNSISETEAKAEFMAGCDTGEYDGEQFDQTEYCGCVYEGMRVDYSVNELAQMGLNKTQDELAVIMQPYANQCLENQGIEL